MATGLVSCEWLRQELGREDIEPLRIIDATVYLPNSPFAAPEGSGGPQSDFLKGPRLPGSGFFDIDGVASPSSLPHMLPSAETFSAAMAELGISRGSRVVVYDRLGIFSAPRFWYTMKVAFDHPAEVAVLDGGLPRWQALGYPVEEGEEPSPPAPVDAEVWNYRPGSSWDLARVLGNMDAKEALVLDARPGPRFKGQAPEPRPGLRWGHIPGTASLPFVSLLTDPPIRTMLPPDELRTRFLEAGFDPDSGERVVLSCGSGLTACVLGLGLQRLGVPLSQMALYDGSWTEWGGQKDTPVQRLTPDGEVEDVP